MASRKRFPLFGKAFLCLFQFLFVIPDTSLLVNPVALQPFFLKIIHIIADDCSFIFNVDKLDEDETQGQLEAGTALARKLREMVVPEIHTNVYKIMTDGAGHKPATAALVP